MPRPALLFDLDGTLALTDHLHFEAMAQMLAENGVTIDWPIYRAKILGGLNADIAAQFLPHLSPEKGRAELARKEAMFRARLTTMPRAKGLTELLAFADERGLACALVTNAPRGNVDAMLGALDLVGRFEAEVLSDELAAGKPNPLPYREAVRRLDADPARTVAFEDSLTGVRSAVGAGVATVGVGESADPPDLLAAGAAMTAADFSDPRVTAFVRARIGI